MVVQEWRSEEAHGGELKDQISQLNAEQAHQLYEEARSMPSIKLNERQVCDAELLMNGGFSPLEGFMTRQEYESVVRDMRLPSGVVWPIPVCLDVASSQLNSLSLGMRIALRDARDDAILAIMTVEDVYQPDRRREAQHVLGTVDPMHPAVHHLLNGGTQDTYLGGRLTAIQLPNHYDHQALRFTPREMRNFFRKMKWSRIVAFQTRNPMHRAHRELTVRAAQSHRAHILIHPVVGLTKPGDVDHYTRVRVYQALMPRYPTGMATLALLPLAMRMAGPREALWHAIIRRNYGCTHFIVGRDHAGPGKDSHGHDFYSPYEAQELVERFRDELGIQVVRFQMVVYCPDTDEYLPQDELLPGTSTLNLSGTELRRRLKQGLPIPDWFSYPEVVAVLRRAYPPRSRQGFTLFITGNQQHTLAKALQVALLQQGGRSVSLLTPSLAPNLSDHLTDQEDHSMAAMHRLIYVATELTRAGAACLCSLSPSRHLTHHHLARHAISQVGGFFFVRVLPTSMAGHLDVGACLNEQNEQEVEQGKQGEEVDLEVDMDNMGVSQIVHDVMLLLDKHGYF